MVGRSVAGFVIVQQVGVAHAIFSTRANYIRLLKDQRMGNVKFLTAFSDVFGFDNLILKKLGLHQY